MELVTLVYANWIVGMGAYPEILYDGHTLRSVLQQVSQILGFEPEMMICVLSYRWYNDKGKCNVQIVNRFRKRISCSFWSVVELAVSY